MRLIGWTAVAGLVLPALAFAALATAAFAAAWWLGVLASHVLHELEG